MAARPVAAALRKRAKSYDVDELVGRISEMGDVLREIAIETQHDKPDIAARAAMGSARAASDVLGTILTREQIDLLVDRISELEKLTGQGATFGDRTSRVIGLNAAGQEVCRPSWGMGGLNAQENCDGEE